MMNCLGFCNNNSYLWLLIIILLVCCGGCGCINNIMDKICNSGCLVPIMLTLLLTCYCKNCGRDPKPFPGCGGCK